MNANLKDELLMYRLWNAGILNATQAHARTLRTAANTLHRWDELKCGTVVGHVEEDETTGQWWYVNSTGNRNRHPVPNQGLMASVRVQGVCDELGCHSYRQTDPRGAALYVWVQPMDHDSYTSGVCCQL